MQNLAVSSLVPHEKPRPGSWGSAVFAGLPHLLMGALIGIGRLGIVRFDLDRQTPAFIGLGLAMFVFGVLIYAWRHSWPLWSASWYLYGAWVVLAILGLGIERLSLEESWRYTNAMFIGWLIVCLIGSTVILTKSRLHGLLSVAFLFPLLGVLSLEFVPDPIEGWLAIGLGALAASAASVAARTKNSQTAFWLIFSVNLIAGVALVYVSEWQVLDLSSGLPLHPPELALF